MKSNSLVIRIILSVLLVFSILDVEAIPKRTLYKKQTNEGCIENAKSRSSVSNALYGNHSLNEEAVDTKSNIQIDIAYGLKTESGNLVRRNGQWVPDDNAEVTGELTIIVQLEGEVNRFSTKIIGVKTVDGHTNYLCENGKSFLVEDGETPVPAVSNSSSTEGKNLDDLIEEYKQIKRLDLAWQIWELNSYQKQ